MTASISLALLSASLGDSDAESVPQNASTGEPFDMSHESVLIEEILRYLEPKDGEVVLDATAGQGGHSEAILSAASVELIALDADPSAIFHTKTRLSRFGERARLIESNFADVEEALARAGITHIDKGLFDLGWNRGQLGAGRGFSFQGDEPLNMSYGRVPASGFSAAEILNTWSEQAIANVLFGYGQERYARRIAKNIAAVRRNHPIQTTGELVAIIKASVPGAYVHGRIHPATKTFQALRIAANDELGALDRGVRAVFEMLTPGGRLGVISFHSIEDRAVKQLFARYAKDKRAALITKKPIIASEEEVRRNPSARSAKLRVIEKASDITHLNL